MKYEYNVTVPNCIPSGKNPPPPFPPGGIPPLSGTRHLMTRIAHLLHGIASTLALPLASE